MSLPKTDYDYLIIPRMQCAKVNALSAYCLASPLNLMAARHLQHALSAQFGFADAAAGVAVLHHDYEFQANRAGRTFYPHQTKSAYGVTPKDYIRGVTLPLQPVMLQRITQSLVFRFKKGAPIDVDAFVAKLGFGRFAGGVIQDFGRVVYTEKQSDIGRTLRTGFWIKERPDLLYRGDASGIEGFVQTLKGNAGREEFDSWISPAVLGYLAISEFKERSGARDGHLSAHAEPLIGYVQYQSVHGVDVAEIPFWDYDVSGDAFTVRQQVMDYQHKAGKHHGTDQKGTER